MGPEDTLHKTLLFETYEYSQSKIRQLKEKMPVKAVESLASEVIRRLAQKGSELKHVPILHASEGLVDLCNALISSDDQAAAQIVSELRADGITDEVVYLKHLAAAARMLGDWWNEDRVSFVEVTLGSARLLAIMRSMRHVFVARQTNYRKSAIFAAVPGETHVLGVHMATDILRKDGWDITLKVGLEHDDLVSEINNSTSGLIGLSMAGEHSIEALSRLVVALHICCPQNPIIVSGSEIEAQRPLISLMGVDAIASDIEDAKAQMTELLTRAS